jgi:hypothetical protein
MILFCLNKFFIPYFFIPLGNCCDALIRIFGAVSLLITYPVFANVMVLFSGIIKLHIFAVERDSNDRLTNEWLHCAHFSLDVQIEERF